MKKRMGKIVVLMVMAISLAFASISFAEDNGASQVEVEVGQENEINVTVLNGGGGDGKDKYMGSAYMPAFEGMFPGTPNIPVTKGSLWSLKDSKRVYLALPNVITREMIPVYFGNKSKLVEDKYEKKKLIDGFSKARKMLMRTANVVVLYDLPATNAVRPYAKYPDARAIKGTDYLAMGSITFQTREGFKKWYKSLKLENISSDDLGMMISEAAMKLGANFFVPTGEGAEVLFGTEAKGANIGALLAGALSLSGSSALPLGGSIGSAFSGTSGSNGLKANPFLSVALVKVIDFKKTFLALSSTEKQKVVADKAKIVQPEPKEKVSVISKLKRDEYLTLAMCANAVPDPNGVTRLQVAEVELEKYLSSERTDLEALSVFQAHLNQATRDNVKGEKLEMAQLGIALAWFERANVVKRARDKQLISDAEFSKAYFDNLSKVEGAMQRHHINNLVSLEAYSSKLKAANLR
ncbi:hypothetical protein HN784_01940 [bacterium]|nr:hypothetical protein [bacterium]MBT4597961.1 hypothetical protein [bacterium]MBT7038003.1 hypothetical protein [bacterium]MBT7431585.1 hypothetical protein [bacterium]